MRNRILKLWPNGQKLILRLILLSLAFIPLSEIDSQELSWEVSYGGLYNETGYSSCIASDGNYVVLGSTFSYGSGDHDLYLLKLNTFGDTIWSHAYGGPDADYGYDLVETSDHGFIIVGATYSYGNGMSDLYIYKVDSIGQFEWQKTYGGTSKDEGRSIRKTSDGGFIIGGTTASSGAGYDDTWLFKINNVGDSLWARTYGGAGGESGYAVRVCPDGGYVLVGSTGSFGTGYSSIYLLKTDQNGDSLWTSILGGAKSDFGYSLETTADSGFVIVGWTSSFGAGYSDVYLLKIDSLGNQQWQQTFGGAKDERGYSIQQAMDGSFIIGGTTESFGHGKIDAWVACLDTLGNEKWSLTGGGSNSDFCKSIMLENKGCVIVGQTYSYSSGGSDIYIWKVTTDQMTPVDERPQALPDDYLLQQNYPNPFNATTTIEYYIPERADAQLKIYNLLGREVRSFNLSDAPAGVGSVIWDGKTSWGEAVSSGVYFYRFVYGRSAVTKKLVLLK